MKRAQIIIIFVAILGVVCCLETVEPNPDGDTTVSPTPTTISTTADNSTTVTQGPTAPTTSSATTKGTETTTTVTPASTTAVNTTVVPTTQSGSSVSELTTTASGTTVNATTDQTIPTTSAPCVQKSFDAASFVGGIVLALGVLVILVIIVKCYNHQSRKSELQYSQF